jgi:hypothetical protein
MPQFGASLIVIKLLQESSVMLLELSIMLLESSITLLENIYSTSMTRDDHYMFIVQATDVNKILFVSVSRVAGQLCHPGAS